eukprot:s1851_g7.t1
MSRQPIGQSTFTGHVPYGGFHQRRDLALQFQGDLAQSSSLHSSHPLRGQSSPRWRPKSGGRYETLLDEGFYGRPILLETEPDQEFLGFMIATEPFELIYCGPTDVSQVLSPFSASPPKVLLSGFRSRCHIVAKGAHPIHRVHAGIQQLIDLYTSAGFEATESLCLCSVCPVSWLKLAAYPSFALLLGLCIMDSRSAMTYHLGNALLHLQYLAGHMPWFIPPADLGHPPTSLPFSPTSGLTSFVRHPGRMPPTPASSSRRAPDVTWFTHYEDGQPGTFQILLDVTQTGLLAILLRPRSVPRFTMLIFLALPLLQALLPTDEPNDVALRQFQFHPAGLLRCLLHPILRSLVTSAPSLPSAPSVESTPTPVLPVPESPPPNPPADPTATSDSDDSHLSTRPASPAPGAGSTAPHRAQLLQFLDSLEHGLLSTTES